MKNPTRRLRTRPLGIASATLAAAAASATVGCSADYPIGDLSRKNLPIESTGTSATEAANVDFSVVPYLPAPDVTLPTGVELGHVISAVGDLDGDGAEDFAVNGVDLATSTEYVHLRYGGPRPTNTDEAFALAESGVRLIIGSVFPLIETITAAGDIDGDGYGDMLVGLGHCYPTREGEGAYLLYGGPDRLEGVARFDEVGVYLKSPRVSSPTEAGGCGTQGPAYYAGLGDFDGDGFDDFVLSDKQEIDLENFPIVAGGKDITAYLFYGRQQRLVSGASWSSADAQLHAEQDLTVNATGDVNADGLGDLILGAETLFEELPGRFFWLPGRRERLSGVVDVASEANVLADGYAAGDVDGDGVADVFLRDANYETYLFYGAAGLFEAGVDFADAAATFQGTANDGAISVRRAGDRDGDGDTELWSRFFVDLTARGSNVAIVSGSTQRLTGRVQFPAQQVLTQNPTGTMIDQNRFLYDVFPGGDLDGDGASDVLTVSNAYSPPEEDGSYWTYQPELHIHYGTPGGVAPTVR